MSIKNGVIQAPPLKQVIIVPLAEFLLPDERFPFLFAMDFDRERERRDVPLSLSVREKCARTALDNGKPTARR